MHYVYTIDIPSTVSYIAKEAFKNCIHLTSVDLPTSLTLLEADAFSGCTGITSITLPGSLSEIKEYTFSYCSNLTSVEFPYGLVRIGKGAFSYCDSLSHITLPGSLTEIGTRAFGNSGAIKEVVYATTDPIATDLDIFDSKVYREATLNVPKEGLIAASNTYPWNNFLTIKGDYVAGIDDVTADVESGDDTPVEYYNLQGVRVANPTSGLYIERRGNKTKKVMIE